MTSTRFSRSKLRFLNDYYNQERVEGWLSWERDKPISWLNQISHNLLSEAFLSSLCSLYLQKGHCFEKQLSYSLCRSLSSKRNIKMPVPEIVLWAWVSLNYNLELKAMHLENNVWISVARILNNRRLNLYLNRLTTTKNQLNVSILVSDKQAIRVPHI